MSKFKIINLIDKVFITCAIFLIIYAWINFFIRDLWTTFFLSLIFSFACVFLLFYFFNKRNEKKFISKQNLKDMEEKFLAFRLSPKSDKLKLLKSIIENKYECKKIKDCLVYFKDEKIHQITLATDTQKLSQFELENLIQNSEKNVSVLQIVCCEVDANLNTKILKNLDVEIITKKELYENYFTLFNTFPDCSNLNTKTDRKKFKEIAKNFFIQNKAKSYFLCGLILIFSSIILPYHTYYLIFGTVFLIFSIICKLQPFFNR